MNTDVRPHLRPGHWLRLWRRASGLIFLPFLCFILWGAFTGAFDIYSPLPRAGGYVMVANILALLLATAFTGPVPPRESKR